MHIELTPTNSTYILTNVIDTSDYKFQVSANTIMGEGERTPAVSASVHSLGKSEQTVSYRLVDVHTAYVHGRHIICIILLLIHLYFCEVF